MSSKNQLICWECILIGQLVGLFVCWIGGTSALACAVTALVSTLCTAHFVKEDDK